MSEAAVAPEPTSVQVSSLPPGTIPQVSPEAKAPPPLGDQNKQISVGDDRKKLAPRHMFTFAEIEEALIKFDGHRQKAAQMLKITPNKLKNLIHDNVLLRNRWSNEAVSHRHKEATRQAMGLPANPVRPADKAMNMLIDIEQETTFRLNRLLTRLEKVASRIERGEEAIDSPEPEFVRKYAFRLDANGAPAEERMLREAFVAMGDLTIKMKKEFRETLWCVHKMEFMDKKYQGNPEAGAKKAKVGFASKAQRMAVPEAIINELKPEEGGQTL